MNVCFCKLYGSELIIADRWFPSSKTCSNCGWHNKELTLSDRTFECQQCLISIDRDWNASLNLANTFLGFRPNESIPTTVSNAGFAFGHTLLGDDTFEVIHFAFKFYGYQTYNVLLNPNNSLVRRVLKVMLTHKNYFFFALNQDNSSATAFRAEIEQDTLRYLRINQSRLQDSKTTVKQYNKAVSQFSQNPHPEGLLLQWVCQNGIEYLDLSKDRMSLNPAS